MKVVMNIKNTIRVGELATGDTFVDPQRQANNDIWMVTPKIVGDYRECIRLGSGHVMAWQNSIDVVKINCTIVVDYRYESDIDKKSDDFMCFGCVQ